MKKHYIYYCLLAALSVVACEKKADETALPDTPVTLEYLRINFQDVKNFQDVIKISPTESFRIDYKLSDEGLVMTHELFALVNDNPNMKYTAFHPTVLGVSNMTFGYVIQNIRELYLDNKTWRTLQPNDQLHFYLLFEDDNQNKSTVRFIIGFE